MAAQLWALTHGGLEAVKGIDEVAHLASSGRTSFAADQTVNRGLYRAAGFRVCGERAVRVDILERLADLIRPAIAYRPGATVGDPPPGAADGEGFVVTVAMTSLAGCSGESFASILKSLGYANEQRPGPAITVPIIAKAAMEPIKPTVAVEQAPAAEEAAPADEETETPAPETAEAAAEAPAEGEATAETVEAEFATAAPEAPAAATVAAVSETPIEAEAPAETVEAEVPAEAQECGTPALAEVAEAAAPIDEVAETAAPAEEGAQPAPQAESRIDPRGGSGSRTLRGS